MLLAGVVPHGVDSEAGLEPLPGGGHLPLTDPAVQISADEHIHLGRSLLLQFLFIIIQPEDQV